MRSSDTLPNGGAAYLTFTEGLSMKQIPYLLAYFLRKVGASLGGGFITREL